MWYYHPDTLMIAQARRLAARAGHPAGSAADRQAYRDAYARVANGSWPESLAHYLAELDAEIADLTAGRVRQPPQPVTICRPKAHLLPFADSAATAEKMAARVLALLPSAGEDSDRWKKAARLMLERLTRLTQRPQDNWERVARNMGRW